MRRAGEIARLEHAECCRACCRATEAPSRARAALGAAAVGGVATAAYAAYGGFGNGNGGAGGKGFGGGGTRRRRRRGERGGTRGDRVFFADFDAATVATVEEVVLLDVRGMHCGGCTANVKRILEMERACVSASVNLANESALVRVAVDVQEHTKYPYAGKGAEAMSGGEASPKSDIARAVRAVGDGLAAVVTEKGFPTTVREACGVAVAGERDGRGAEQA